MQTRSEPTTVIRSARTVRAACAAAALLAVSACSSGPTPPDLAAPQVTGTVYVAGTAADGSSTVWQVTRGAAKPLLSEGAQILPLTSVSLSPDGAHLAYVSANSLYVKDLRTGAALPGRLAADAVPEAAADPGMPQGSPCSVWSPDGKRVAFTVQRGVFVFDTAGTGSRVSGRPVSAWREGRRDLRNLASPPTYHDARATSEMTCAHWAGATRLVFDRVGQDRAESIGSAAEANTTTLARVDAKAPQLTNLSARWSASDTCGDRVLLDYHPEQSPAATPSPVANSARRPGAPLLMAASSLDYRAYADSPQTAAEALTSTGIAAEGSVWYFAPDTCRLTTAAPKSADEGTYDYLVTTLDGKTGKTVQQRTLPLAVGAGSPLARPAGGHVTALAAPGGHTIAYATRDGKIAVVDLGSGGATELKGPWKNAVSAVGWRNN
ncbi:TolB family protein [Streptomyces celluloflavus]|uniref:TolB family protein n=1 Tax=Streptomyces celluloflavus TaxID=58344 RepID=UPI0036543E17